jgi:hypothetical protein
MGRVRLDLLTIPYRPDPYHAIAEAFMGA